MTNKAKRYVKERDEMLMKRSVEALEAFVKSHADMFEEGFRETFMRMPEGIKEATLHKMIVGAVKLPENIRRESAMWLAWRGMGVSR